MATDKPAKVMDGVHSGDTPPPSTSRPVIVSNRPFMATDPMLNEAATGVDKPSGEPADKPQDEAGVPAEVSRQAKDIVPTEQVAPAEQPATQEEPSPKQEPPALSITETTDESDVDEEEDEVTASLTPKVQLSAEEEAVQAREAELENMIAAGTYAVPINSARKKRAATVTILLLVIVLAVVALDILLDMNVLTFSGVPHTNLIGN